MTNTQFKMICNLLSTIALILFYANRTKVPQNIEKTLHLQINQVDDYRGE